MMEQKIVITIARQYGSGGRKIGKIVADQLGIPFLDKKIISEAIAESGIHANLIVNNDEKAGNPLGQAFAAGGMHSYFNSPRQLKNLPKPVLASLLADAPTMCCEMKCGISAFL